MHKLQNVIYAQEKIAPGEETLVARQTKILVLGAERIKLVQLFVAGQRARRLEMIDDRERHEHGAAPGRHLVNVKRRPLRQQNHLHRDGGQIFPGKLAQQREIKFAERVHGGNAAEAQDGRARFLHERRVRRITGELQREIRFDRRVDFARPAVINIPAAVRQLAFQDVTHATLLHLLSTSPSQCMKRTKSEQSVLSTSSSPHQWPSGVLLPQQIFLGPTDRAEICGVGWRIETPQLAVLRWTMKSRHWTGS